MASLVFKDIIVHGLSDNYDSNRLLGFIQRTGSCGLHNSAQRSESGSEQRESTMHLIVADAEDAIMGISSRCVADQLCHVPVLRTLSGGVIGPTYLDHGTACASCAALRLLSNDSAPTPIDPTAKRSFEDSLWESVLIRELSTFLTGLLPSLTINHSIECDSIRGTISRRRVLRLPNCTCRGRAPSPLAAWQV